MTSTHYRSHSVGEIDKSMLGSCVHLIGWVDRIRDHGGVTFIDLRDASGLVQVVINDEQQARGIKVEDVIQVEGKVRKRPEGEENSKLANGEVEVEASKIQIVSEAATLPFQVSTSLENSGELNLPSEETRLRYRYLDLRRASMRKVLRTRSDMAKAAREALDSMGFMEVETPTLIKSTPEGARDFLVPARLSPGNWYALPQSPQLLKQLLMIG
ncbi:MAG: Asp-tRNA(Asn)/Glu-tRNA(Gln) amidotransferase GatCAB subunit C, partial [Aeriscardovia sp.]|nr:Asp-tRNA(Asn)/Glu-tRNA(Gln) amidotransferase GatCAB subunit C [Aeriscardovia sp.]